MRPGNRNANVAENAPACFRSSLIKSLFEDNSILGDFTFFISSVGLALRRVRYRPGRHVCTSPTLLRLITSETLSSPKIFEAEVSFSPDGNFNANQRSDPVFFSPPSPEINPRQL